MMFRIFLETKNKGFLKQKYCNSSHNVA